MQTEERFLKYIKFDTQSKEEVRRIPSTEKQRKLAEYLYNELKSMGAKHIRLTPASYVYAEIPATSKRDIPALGFISHIDTSPEVSGANIKPQIINAYPGGDVTLNKSRGIILPSADYPQLNNYIGQDVIFTDGTTLLGADDKAGVAEIMTMAEYFLDHPEIEHGKIMIGFTPDEEVGRGADEFNVKKFGADFAFTVDGEAANEIEYENFNAASALVEITGYSIHPGTAKGKMKNACLLAMEFHNMLPSEQAPVYTEGYEGFFHLAYSEADVEHAVLKYAVRDHSRELFSAKKSLMEAAAAAMNEKYGKDTVKLTLTDSYYNMKEKILPHMHLIDNAKKAMMLAGLEPKTQPIRGGTDGARLSYMALPCPNLGTGGHNFHSRFEYISVQSLRKVTEVLINIVKIYAE